MKECKKCKVFIQGNNKVCPLCQGKLDGEDDESRFPKIDTVYNQYKTFFKLLVFGTVSAGIVSVAINLMLPKTGIWSLFVVLGVMCFWFSLTIAFKNRNNIPKNFLHQVVIISLMCILWDYVTGWKGWSLDYVFPISCAVAILSTVILSLVLKIKNQDYKIYLITNIILGLGPLVLHFVGIISISIPSLVCAAVSMMVFVFALLFYGDDTKKELLKWLHL